jgi:endonuclease III
LRALNKREIQSKMLFKIRKHFPVRPWKPGYAFATLIHTILSQNTNDQNSNRAMRQLRRRYKINPSILAEADITDLTNVVRPAGLYRSKATHIREVSRIIQFEYEGKLSGILNLPYRDAKNTLTSLPGVGPKTADILLAFVAGHFIIPVDTHVARIAKRLCIVSPNANYETIRLALESLTTPRQRLPLHLSMIRFGRTICKAPKPLCEKCLISKECPSSSLHFRTLKNSF